MTALELLVLGLAITLFVLALMVVHLGQVERRVRRLEQQRLGDRR